MKSILIPDLLTILKIIFKPASSRLAVLAMLVSGIVPAAALAQANTKFAERVDALMTEYVRSELFAGTVLVARDGKTVFRKAYGMANREWMTPNTVKTRYRIGSITKQFTAAAILQLADRNKLGLDDPISKYLPDLPAGWGPATIRQLLLHTAGIPS